MAEPQTRIDPEQAVLRIDSRGEEAFQEDERIRQEFLRRTEERLRSRSPSPHSPQFRPPSPHSPRSQTQLYRPASPQRPPLMFPPVAAVPSPRGMQQGVPAARNAVAAAPESSRRVSFSAAAEVAEPGSPSSSLQSLQPVRRMERTGTMKFQDDESKHQEFIRRTNFDLHSKYAGQAAPKPISVTELNRLSETSQVSLMSAKGKYVVVQMALDGQLAASSDVPDPLGMFQLQYYDRQTVALMGINRKFVQLKGMQLHANGDVPLMKFSIAPHAHGGVSLKSMAGQFLAEEGGKIIFSDSERRRLRVKVKDESGNMAIQRTDTMKSTFSTNSQAATEKRSDTQLFHQDETAHEEFIRRTNEALRSKYKGQAGPRLTEMLEAYQVCLRSTPDKFLIAGGDGELHVSSNYTTSPEVFHVENQDGNNVSLKSADGKYVVVGDDGRLIANGDSPGLKFVMTEHADGTIVMRTPRNEYLVEEGGLVQLSESDRGKLQLQTGHSQILDSPLGPPEEVSFRSVSGTFIGAQKDGQLLASSSSVGTMEKFKVQYHDRNIVSLMSGEGKHLVFGKGKSLAANGDTPSLKFTLVRVDGVIILKTLQGENLVEENGKIVASKSEKGKLLIQAEGPRQIERQPPSPKSPLSPRSPRLGPQIRQMERQSNEPKHNELSLRGLNNKFVVPRVDGPLLSSSDFIGTLEKFQLRYHDGNTFSLLSAHGKYVAVGGGKHLVANGDVPITKFVLFTNADGSMSLQTANGEHVCEENGQALVRNSEKDRLLVDTYWNPNITTTESQSLASSAFSGLDHLALTKKDSDLSMGSAASRTSGSAASRTSSAGSLQGKIPPKQICLRTARAEFVYADTDGDLIISGELAGSWGRFEMQYHDDMMKVVSLKSTHGKYVYAHGKYLVAKGDVATKFSAVTSEDGSISLTNEFGDFIAEEDGRLVFSASEAARLHVEVQKVNDLRDAGDLLFGKSSLPKNGWGCCAMDSTPEILEPRPRMRRFHRYIVQTEKNIFSQTWNATVSQFEQWAEEMFSADDSLTHSLSTWPT